jgi:hypothetical protein
MRWPLQRAGIRRRIAQIASRRCLSLTSALDRLESPLIVADLRQHPDRRTSAMSERGSWQDRIPGYRTEGGMVCPRRWNGRWHRAPRRVPVYGSVARVTEQRCPAPAAPVRSRGSATCLSAVGRRGKRVAAPRLIRRVVYCKGWVRAGLGERLGSLSAATLCLACRRCSSAYEARRDSATGVRPRRVDRSATSFELVLR